ncbi:hypothetical protein [Pinibacter aurantiacus]|uniref:Uncharacterized protein n=1 Tax=Pinibacter aurantiacus TaxID=2851599 RepID=A0A9E2W2T3_9BACT|nr:hypothetical protein [Pinibacter aurantiacus]MBV4356149.1 hypothetical protein [Pinibacter aurantiacus]
MPKLKVILLLLIFGSMSRLCFAQQYKNFKVSIYCRAYEVQKMQDTTNYLKPLWNEITRQMKVDKIYLETHRDLLIVDQKTLDIAKQFFKDRGVEIAGGITYTISEPNRFQTFCYSDPNDRKKVKEIAEYTAKNFDTFILDDFFFTNCKDDGAIKEKGTKSWTQYRLDLMAEAAKSLVVGPAKAVNPKVKVIIKYPNWYEHFQGLGFNLEKQPSIFDGIYTGTETRDATLTAQHLQPYLGYSIIRYYDNIAPGRNGGGWVDPGLMGTYDRYAEQLWLTLFAKAPEETLFDFRQIIMPLDIKFRAPWQGQQTSFDYDEMMKPVNHNGGAVEKPTTLARAAGYTFEKVDQFLGKLGNPVGIKSYRPYHSTGEDFLQNYLGMIGLPMDMSPEFPAKDSVILLTEEAKFDAAIVSKIKKQLTEGKSVIITSGLLKALQGKGIEDIAEIYCSDRKALVQDFTVARSPLMHIDKPIIIPQITYLTNDSWEMVSAVNGPNGWPLLHEADYSKGKLYILTIPDNFADLYNLPAEALNVIRKALGSQLKVSIEGAGNISLFLYDNNTCIVESFLPTTTSINIVTAAPFKKLTDIVSNETISGTERKPQTFWFLPKNNGSNVFTIAVKPHSFRVFRFE